MRGGLRPQRHRRGLAEPARPGYSENMRPLAVFLLLWLGFGHGCAAEITVMSYNLRFAGSKGPEAWNLRRPLMKACLERHAPDLIGTQEGLAAQLADLRADFPAYAMLGQGREGGDKGEYMAVFYRRARFEALASGDYWFSDTPETVGSRSWGNQLPRMVTWVRLRDRSDGRELLFVNTHFDHLSQPSREKSAGLLRKKIADFRPELPVLVTGDFNAVAGANPAYATLTSDGFLLDLFRAAPRRRNADLNTFNGFKPAVRKGEHIDWVLGRGAWEATEAEVSEFAVEGRFPSDHFPVVVKVRPR